MYNIRSTEVLKWVFDEPQFSSRLRSLSGENVYPVPRTQYEAAQQLEGERQRESKLRDAIAVNAKQTVAAGSEWVNDFVMMVPKVLTRTTAAELAKRQEQAKAIASAYENGDRLTALKELNDFSRWARTALKNAVTPTTTPRELMALVKNLHENVGGDWKTSETIIDLATIRLMLNRLTCS